MVATWNSAAEVPALIASVDEHVRSEHELIFVDNGSADDTVELIERTSPSSVVIPLGENRGFAAANNVGVREARHPVTVLLNPDTILPDPSLEDLVGFAAETGSLCGPRLLYEDGTPQISAFAAPASWQAALSAVAPARLLPGALRVQTEPWRAERTQDVGWLTGACIAGRTELMQELGPFDDSFPLYGEDLDLALRARERGLRNVIVPSTRVIHLGERSSRQRFSNGSVALKVAARRRVVRSRLRPLQSRLDDLTQIVLYGTRLLAKRALGRPATLERAALRELLRPAAGQLGSGASV